MKSRTSQILYAYWNEVRGKRIAPRRFEIEPARIGSILPETFILERSEPGKFSFRLSGTRIFECFGSEFRGANFLDLWSPDDREAIAVNLTALATQGAALTIEFDGTAEDGRTARFEAAILPLVHTGQVIDRVLGSISALQDPGWLGSVRLDTLKVLRAEVIWPDGRPYAVLAAGERQAPFLAQTRGARLVRHERRQFRVYDGGLAKTEDDR